MKKFVSLHLNIILNMTENEVLEIQKQVVDVCKLVYDPEIPVNIYDLGLIYELTIDKSHRAYVKMTFTAPTCPMADEVMSEVKRSVEDVPGITGCDMELVFEPVWDQSMMSDEARVIMGFDPQL